MNLGAIGTMVGQRLGIDTSSASLRDGAAVRAFLTMRHDQLYRCFLWKDSVCDFCIPINPATPYTPTSNYMPTKGRIILPPIFEKVLGVRYGWRALKVERPMLYYRSDFNNFFNGGCTSEFYLLSSCVWEFDTVQQVGINCANAADANTQVQLDVLQSDEVTVTRQAAAASLAGTIVATTDRIDNIIKPATQGVVSFGVNSPVYGWRSNIIPNGATYALNQYTLTGLTVGVVYLVTWGANDASLLNGSQGINTGGIGSTSQFTAQGTSVNFVSVIPLGPPGSVTVTVQPQTSVNSISKITTLQPSDTYELRSQRIQLVGKPTSTFTATCPWPNLSVLGKRNTPPFAADSDIPGIAGLDGILFALAYYDFCQRDERGGTPDAEAALIEAVGPNFLSPPPGQPSKPGGFLGKLIEEEVVQAAYNCRIIPQMGYGGDYYNEPWGSKTDPYYIP